MPNDEAVLLERDDTASHLRRTVSDSPALARARPDQPPRSLRSHVAPKAGPPGGGGAGGRAQRPGVTIDDVNRDYILAEIRRTAQSNGGVPLGRARFERETGIRESDWKGRYWARWGDALVEAGFPPNRLRERYPDDEVLAALVVEIRRHGRMPTEAELRMRRRADSTFPSSGVFEKFGRKSDLAQRVADYCTSTTGHEDVLTLISRALPTKPSAEEPANDEPGNLGYVYLLRSGKHFKIGHTYDVGRRRYELAIQLPEPIVEVHVIRTDDPTGIERYWHTRFADRRRNGEWFELDRRDVSAFCRRRFM